MPLLEELPQNIQNTLQTARNGTGDEPLTIAVKTDIGASGDMGERWVIVDKHAVRVLSANGDKNAAHLDLAVPMSEIASAKTENLVGGGALTLSRGADAVEVARYTQPLAGRMGSVARAIDALAKGDEPPVADLDAEDERIVPDVRAAPSRRQRCVPVLYQQNRNAYPLVFLCRAVQGAGRAFARAYVRRNCDWPFSRNYRSALDR